MAICFINTACQLLWSAVHIMWYCRWKNKKKKKKNKMKLSWP